MRAPITVLLLAAAALTPAALAFAPDDTVHIGVEPARVVRYHKELQHKLGQSGAWSAFQADFGESWQARFDERTGLPTAPGALGLTSAPFAAPKTSSRACATSSPGTPSSSA
jgi:hypothetical protein